MRATRPERQPQPEYSSLQPLTRDRTRRRVKAEKIVRVVQHFLGREELGGLTALDIGASTGFTVAALSEAGATAVGLDIDRAGLVWARREVAGAQRLFVGDGSRLPLADRSIDIVVLNHIYEHVVDPDAIMDEIRRVLAPNGIAYLGLGNKLGVMEPHYRLPFLSWLPRTTADHYMRLTGRGESYYEQFRTRRELLRMCHGFAVWDYTFPILSDPDHFGAQDVVADRLRSVPHQAWKALTPVIPTYIWVVTLGTSRPRGARTEPSPARLTTRS